MNGFILLHRKLLSNPLWSCEPFTRGQAWVDLLLLANHKDGFIIVNKCRIPVLRGQVGYSIESLKTRWRWSRGKVERFLIELESDQQIERNTGNRTGEQTGNQTGNRTGNRIRPASTIITITNYDEFQKVGNRTGEQTGNQTGNRTGNRTEGGRVTNNNGNNVKEKRAPFLFFILEQTGKTETDYIRTGTTLTTWKIILWHVFEKYGYTKQQCSAYYDRIQERNFCNKNGDPYTPKMLVDELAYYHKRGWLNGGTDDNAN